MANLLASGAYWRCDGDCQERAEHARKQTVWQGRHRGCALSEEDSHPLKTRCQMKTLSLFALFNSREKMRLVSIRSQLDSIDDGKSSTASGSRVCITTAERVWGRERVRWGKTQSLY